MLLRSSEFIDSIKQLQEKDYLRNALSINGRKLMEKYTVQFWKESFLNGVRK